MQWIRVVAIATFVWLSGCSSQTVVAPPAPAANQIKPEVDAEIDTMFGLIRERLMLMHDVARWKLQEGLPITDRAREQAVIEQTARFAQEKGLDVDLATRFMKAQIEAGKQIQELDLEAWKISGKSNQTVSSDLSKELRPKIDQLGKALVISLARLAPHLDDASVLRILQQRATQLSRDRDLDQQACATALAPLLGE